jgi:hypothetical protein
MPPSPTLRVEKIVERLSAFPVVLQCISDGASLVGFSAPNRPDQRAKVKDLR